MPRIASEAEYKDPPRASHNHGRLKETQTLDRDRRSAAGKIQRKVSLSKQFYRASCFKKLLGFVSWSWAPGSNFSQYKYQILLSKSTKCITISIFLLDFTAEMMSQTWYK